MNANVAENVKRECVCVCNCNMINAKKGNWLASVQLMSWTYVERIGFHRFYGVRLKRERICQCVLVALKCISEKKEETKQTKRKKREKKIVGWMWIARQINGTAIYLLPISTISFGWNVHTAERDMPYPLCCHLKEVKSNYSLGTRIVC